jgi:adenosylcobinamide kinase/adenosylcobinamide-phosphate guanylyltransferase
LLPYDSSDYGWRTLRQVALLFVTNEVGMGLHASTPMGRDSVELQGWINQRLAQQSERVTFMVAGLPLTVK